MMPTMPPTAWEWRLIGHEMATTIVTARNVRSIRISVASLISVQVVK